jgi:hypothetical protein
MGRLRRKVDGSNEAPMIRNVRGVGFVLVGEAVRAGHPQFAVGQGREFGELDCKLGHAVQIEPDLWSLSPENGNISISAGDYRRFRSRSAQFRSPETDSQFAKARHWRAFLRVHRVKSPGARLVGWRRSADRTRLHVNSLLTGNFTGNFRFSSPEGPIS